MLEFALYLDDTGSPKPNIKDTSPIFSMGGVIVNRADHQEILEKVQMFKDKWCIPAQTSLHSSEIRSRKKAFSWLNDLEQEEQIRFHNDLTAMIVSCPIIVHACVISRKGYCDRYLEKYGFETWNMMRTAFIIAVERAAKWTMRKNGRLMVYYEKIGKNEDSLIEYYFHELRLKGHPFDATTASKYQPLSESDLSMHLAGIEGKTKKNVMTQLADLCLHPLAMQRHQSSNKALSAMREHRLIIDSHLPEDSQDTEGVKFFGFD